MADLAAGDVVQLKSGGPLMVVLEARPPAITCIWFDAALHIQQADFGVALLTDPVRKPATPPGRATGGPGRKPPAR